MRSMNRKVRSVLSAILTFIITVSCVCITTCIEAKMAWLNKNNLKNSVSQLGYANKSIQELKENTEALLKYYGIKCDGLGEIINEDSLYSSFLNNENGVLDKGVVDNADTNAYELRLRGYVEDRLNGLYLSEGQNKGINHMIDEAVHLYNNYMHSEFFYNQYKFIKEYNKTITIIMIIAIIMLITAVTLLLFMYTYIRHSLKFVVCGIIPAIIANIAISFYVGNAAWVNKSGVEPTFYRQLIVHHCSVGKKIGIAICALEVLVIVLLTARINKTKKSR